MKPFIFHALTAAGQRIDAVVFSDASIEHTRDVFEKALREEHPDAIIVDYHEAEREPEEKPKPALTRDPYTIEKMVMMGYSLMISIVFLMRWLARRQR